jgi:hypothetical protein
VILVIRIVNINNISSWSNISDIFRAVMLVLDVATSEKCAASINSKDEMRSSLETFKMSIIQRNRMDCRAILN